MSFAAIGLLFITACVSAQQRNAPNPVQTIYANEFRSLEKDPHVAQLLAQSGTDWAIGQNIHGNFEYRESEVKDHLDELDLAITYHETVGHYVQLYMHSNPDRLKLLFGLTQYYSTTVSSTLSQRGLPQMLGLIPAVCSSYRPTSSNDHGGVGPWHLNYPQAIRYGLRVEKNIDERREMDKATVAAVAYLSDLHKLYGNWELTLAAYTCGPATINSALSRHEATSFWEIYPFLPEEMRDIVPALAALEYVQNMKGDAASLKVKMNTDTVRIRKRLLFKAVKDVVKGDLNELRFLNPALNTDELPSNYTAVFSVGFKQQFLVMKDSLYLYQDSVLLYPKPKLSDQALTRDANAIIHTVKSGEFLGIIAKRYKVGVSQIQYWNDMGVSTRIDVGQKLVIYDREQRTKITAIAKRTEQTHPDNKAYITHIVQQGECLDGIAKKYPGISARNIMELNNIDANIQPNLLLKIKKK